MKTFLTVFIAFFFAGTTSIAYGLPPLTTVNLKAYYTGLNAAGWRSDALDVDTAGILTMYARHFTLSSDDSTDFINLKNYDPDFKSLYSANARRVANQIDSGRTIDFSGVSITKTGSAQTTYTLHTDLIISACCPITCAGSFWITKDKN